MGHLTSWTCPSGVFPTDGVEMLLQHLKPPSDWQHPLSFLTGPGHPQNQSAASETHWSGKTVKLPEAPSTWRLLQPHIFYNLASSQLFLDHRVQAFLHLIQGIDLFLEGVHGSFFWDPLTTPLVSFLSVPPPSHFPCPGTPRFGSWENLLLLTVCPLYSISETIGSSCFPWGWLSGVALHKEMSSSFVFCSSISFLRQLDRPPGLR